MFMLFVVFFFFFSSRRRHTRSYGDWSSDVCSSDLENNHRPFPPSFRAAVKPSMNDIVFREIAGSGRGKAEMDRSVEFNLCRLTIKIGRASCRERVEIYEGEGCVKERSGERCGGKQA